MYISAMTLLIPSILESEKYIKPFGDIDSLQPELDTIRFYIPAEIIDLSSFIPDTCEKMFYSYEWNNDTNEWDISWQKFRNDQRNSWWGTMQITRESLPHYFFSWNEGKRVVSGFDEFLSVEYSVAKWYNVSNGINNYQANTWEHVIFPVISCLKKMYVENYLKDGNDFRDLVKWIYEKAILRRFDLSKNFKVAGASVSDTLNFFGRIPFRRQAAKPYEKENLTCPIH